MRLRLTCREVTALVLQSQDRPLGGWERTVLRLHWLACGGCRQFRRQAALMQRAVGQWRAYRDAGEAGEAADEAPGGRGDAGRTPR